mmetsp:Transcript_63315/g.151044  ORF Transcript_63315/g.151044 Transcript_63315/m.151044 type:complete len:324 (+) Transcript_63315:106-1077(+)
MAANSAAKYQQEDGESERPMKVCAEAGRRCVRNIHQYPILSVEWIALVDSLKQLTRLVQLEGRMPANTKVNEAQGRNRDSEGTLWDQEAHENAIRILVEEAKVNLCLRMMNDFKKWQYDATGSRNTIQDALQTYDYNQTQLEQKCQQFEESLGLLLWRSFMHVETLQLMDIPLLVEHIVMILDEASQSGYDHSGKAKMQEHVVLHYFSSLMKHAEALNNSELLAKTKERCLVQKVTAYLLTTPKISDCFAPDIVSSVAEGYAAMADNEDFRTTWQEFLTCAAEKATFLELESKLVLPLLEENPSRKKDLRPLTDFFRVVQRTM